MTGVQTCALPISEKQMLALVFGEMKAMLGIRTEAEKMLVLAALNLVECIGEVAKRSSV